EMLSEIDGTDIGTALSQAVELLWSQRFGSASTTKKATAPEQLIGSKKEKRKKTEKKIKKAVKTENAKANKTAKNQTETVPVVSL
ncbi:MAG: hypothetical protein IAF00_00530, partial [Phycisphaerales bacterium]|nr:hypothetical protein [Phycisphaerales bacterium]